MTVPIRSSQKDDNAVSTVTGISSTEASEPPRAASVAFIRSWTLSALCLLFFPLLIGLGNWQLHRAEEKQQILQQVNTRLSSQPVAVADLESLEIFTPVRLLGVYTDEYLYLDNRTRNGRVGYEVLQAFEVSANAGDAKAGQRSRWLINRGWLAAGADRNQLPEVRYPLAAKVVTGFLYPSAESDTVGARPPAKPGDEHVRIQSMDTGLGRQLGLQHPQWHVRLGADSDTALVTDWQLITTNPQKHRGYAVQWFMMAAALLIMWLLAATRTREIVREKWFKNSPEQT
ncbi:SURF1 family protein [Microbulbifer salipaludis]|uniref:SURF1-like protein n=1 Tax=Microbulbifer salipaludis TaxID=187980 RepID=A0ABS3E2J3_9GAMM|nr:SURF1 family protein [Microbulbifer salipaludis]MBN8429511.1 SURF1 family protein [Microbulbifer salipaludis]